MRIHKNKLLRIVPHQIQRLTTIPTKHSNKLRHLHNLENVVPELGLELVFPEPVGYEQHQGVLDEIKLVHI